MAAGIQQAIGVGKETTWGTAVPSTYWVSATESITEDRGRLREPMTFGTRSHLPADNGRVGIRGSLSGFHARPVGIGHFLAAALGSPSSVAGPPAVHTFTPQTAKVSDEAAVQPYSATIKRSSLIHRYSGGQLNQLTLNQPSGDALSVDSDWIFKAVEDTTEETTTLESGSRFLFVHLAVTKASVAFPYVESLTIRLNNALEVEETLNESREISAVDFGGKLDITVDMTLTFRDVSTYADFKAGTTSAWSFIWTIDSDNKLEIAIPKLNLNSFSAPISGPGRMTLSVSGTAEYDSGEGHELQAILTNSESSY